MQTKYAAPAPQSPACQRRQTGEMEHIKSSAQNCG